MASDTRGSVMWFPIKNLSRLLSF